MRFICTRGGKAATPSEAIVQGLSPEGGLYVPESFPQIDLSTLDSDYKHIAVQIISSFLTDTSVEKIREIVGSAYKRFDCEEITPVRELTAAQSMLELWHGPTMAFKDVALQILPYLMRNALDITGEKREIYILVATSGDTGKAALEGFKDVPGTRVLVFYPYGGVSEAQRLQMVTQEGSNVDACAIRGNFDDAQTGVKAIFNSSEMSKKLNEKGLKLSSANSINFGRLLPQIVYYFYSYKFLCEKGRIKPGDKINFCVPTGNFGDILAGYYAKRMGLPVNKLICASNRNNVLYDFIRTGRYDCRRDFFIDMSCSIDILISSNLERLLFELCDRDSIRLSGLMRSLKENGSYSISDSMLASLQKDFACGWCTEEETLDEIRSTYNAQKYLIDPHTAVAEKVYNDYVSSTSDDTQTIVLSTADPFKFSTAVLSAFEKPVENDFKNADRLSAISGRTVPEAFSSLLHKPERHTGVCAIDEMPERVLKE